MATVTVYEYMWLEWANSINIDIVCTYYFVYNHNQFPLISFICLHVQVPQRTCLVLLKAYIKTYQNSECLFLTMYQLSSHS